MENIINQILKEKLIVIIRGVSAGKILPLAQALYDGGIRLIEYTYGTASDEETAEIIAALAEKTAGQMYVGAGTVTSEKQVELTKHAGGSFIISPNTNPDVIKYTKKLELVSIPGAMTPSEINTALRAGADFFKLFPAFSLGADYIKAVKAPFANARLIAVGGINEDNLSEYYRAKACGFGIGSSIVNKKLVELGDFDSITRSAKRYVEIIQNLSE